MDNLCPVDGRYREQTAEIREHGFTESQLILTKAGLELAWLLHLIPILKRETDLVQSDEEEGEAMRCVNKLKSNLISDRTIRDQFVKSVLDIERNTSHDTKAVELALREALIADKCPEFLKEMTHMGLTSEDVTGASYTLMFHRVYDLVLLPQQKDLVKTLVRLAEDTKSSPILSMTHGQPASPTTFGKELCVFLYRLKTVEFCLPFFSSSSANHTHTYSNPRIKFGGAVGTHGALQAAFPRVDWLKEIETFVKGLSCAADGDEFGLDLCTTQIPNREWILMRLRSMELQNNIFLDLARDLWFYISRGLLILHKGNLAAEVGSSVMPHKINPIDFENAEGNFTLANGMVNILCTKLSQSRAQRDLSDSTVIRNLGLCFSYTLIAYKSLMKGLGKISLNKEYALKEISEHPEIVAEPIQTILRKYPKQIKDPYEQLKALTRGTENKGQNLVTELGNYIDSLRDVISSEDYNHIKNQLLKNPASYTGLAEETATQVIALWK